MGLAYGVTLMPGFGRIQSTDSHSQPRMMSLLVEPPPSLPVPDRMHWSFRGKPLDQGNTGTCTAHAAAHFIHAAPFTHKAFLDPFALYREIVLLDTFKANDHEATEPDNSKLQGGSTGTAAAKALAARGLISGFLFADTLSDATLWLLTRGPVMFGTDWYDSMVDVTPEGFVKIAKGARVVGGHEYCCLGVDTKRGVFFFVNSWGPAWGKNGRFLMDIGTLTQLFKAGGDAVSPLEIKGR